MQEGFENGVNKISERIKVEFTLEVLEEFESPFPNYVASIYK
jgi:hypothetical protein